MAGSDLPALEEFDVVGAFVGGGVGAAAEVEGSAHLVEGLVFVLLQPVHQAVEHVGEHAVAVAQYGGDGLHGVGAGEEGFDHVFGVVHSAAGGEGEVYLRREDGQPAQAGEQLAGIGEAELGIDREGFEVEVGLIKAVEEHDAARTTEFQLSHKMGGGGVPGGELYGDRDVHGLNDAAHDEELVGLDGVGVGIGVGG